MPDLKDDDDEQTSISIDLNAPAPKKLDDDEDEPTRVLDWDRAMKKSLEEKPPKK